ncbi:MAG: AAA family ATPase [Prevotellaceae bacterium]|jgi:exodeoxyribonuclease-5|nr:AAA family ATPase [Prevotellaceae bacterium]
MIADDFMQLVRMNLPYQPTPQQDKAIERLAEFVCTSRDEVVFILRGYAGTGKTSMVAALVRALDGLKQRSVLMAPTGRAAKVFAAYAGHPAFTIHRRIYRQESLRREGGSFRLHVNLTGDTLFIVDEASMIATAGTSDNRFGSGRLLDDLVEFVYSGRNCRLLLMGDAAQLPPVGEARSGALIAEVLQGYGLEVMQTDLTGVVRQAADSGILWNATRLREQLARGTCSGLPAIRLDGFADIRALGGEELTDTLSDCYARQGIEESIVICRSNKQAGAYNRGIRAQILCYEEEISGGDLLMIAKNNYFWLASQTHSKEADFLANGETVVVRRVRGSHECYGFRFTKVMLRLPYHDDRELEVLLLPDTLHSEAPALAPADHTRLFEAVLEEYAHLPKAEGMKQLRSELHYNALQVKYAYAVTCHKAQGGEWKNVFVDVGYVPPEQQGVDYYRWLYTAYTRATEHLYLVNYR